MTFPILLFFSVPHFLPSSFSFASCLCSDSVLWPLVSYLWHTEIWLDPWIIAHLCVCVLLCVTLYACVYRCVCRTSTFLSRSFCVCAFVRASDRNHPGSCDVTGHAPNTSALFFLPLLVKQWFRGPQFRRDNEHRSIKRGDNKAKCDRGTTPGGCFTH